MGARVIPERPAFADDSERFVWEALRRTLRDEDVLMHGVRFTDDEYGEVEIDLLVLFFDVGAAVIEVKGGHVTFSDGSFHQSGADGIHDIDPIAQARKGVYALRRFLERQPTWSRGAVRAGWLVCFPYTEVHGDMGPEGRRDRIIGKSDLPAIHEKVYDHLCSPEVAGQWPPRDWLDAALAHLRGAMDSPGEVAARAAARLRRVDELTAAQATCLTFVANHPRFCVTGPAGTGKTWLAMEQARRWAAAGERVCLVSYGRGVAETMKRAMADLPRRERPAFTGTFHELGWRWGVTAPPDADEAYWEQAAPAEMLDRALALEPGQRFSAFVVDEAQDFADSWWPALLASASSDQFRLAVFRDDEQSVFHDRRGVPELDLAPFVLSENLRNADEIASVFRPLVSASFTSRSGSGFDVRYVDCAASEAMGAADDIAADLLDQGWLPEHVALLTTQHRHDVQVELAGDKAAYWDAFWATDEIFYSTVAGFKGLERTAVVLAVDGFHEGVDPRSVLYAGMSRARDLLIVVGPSSLIEPVVGERVMKRLRAS